MGYDWPPYLKLLLALLHELQQATDPEVLLPLLRALNLLVLHGDALRQAALKWPAHVDLFLRKYIVPRYVLYSVYPRCNTRSVMRCNKYLQMNR